MFDVPVWAAGGGEKMAQVLLPQMLGRLLVYKDQGEAGERFAQKTWAANLRNVLLNDAGIPDIHIIGPRYSFRDFNEEYQALGAP